MSMGEETEAILEDLVVHEAEEYFLIEVNSSAAIARLKADEAFIERLLELRQRDPDFYETFEMDLAEVQAWARASKHLELEPGAPPVRSENVWRDRPTTDTWHPDAQHRTDEFVSVDAASLRERVHAGERSSSHRSDGQ